MIKLCTHVATTLAVFSSVLVFSFQILFSFSLQDDDDNAGVNISLPQISPSLAQHIHRFPACCRKLIGTNQVTILLPKAKKTHVPILFKAMTVNIPWVKPTIEQTLESALTSTSIKKCNIKFRVCFLCIDVFS
ncbi:hypothetical protein CsSME_00016240 [Camellia sinensis var. sinensis]